MLEPLSLGRISGEVLDAPGRSQHAYFLGDLAAIGVGWQLVPGEQVLPQELGRLCTNAAHQQHACSGWLPACTVLPVGRYRGPLNASALHSCTQRSFPSNVKSLEVP